MNSWKEYEDTKKKEAIITIILASIFGLTKWTLYSAILHFLYNVIAQLAHFPQFNFWVFFFGYALIQFLVKIIRKA